MSVDQAGPGFLRKTWCRLLRSGGLRPLFAGAIAGAALTQSALAAQPPNTYGPAPSSSVQPQQFRALQLEDTSVSGKVDAVHSPNVEALLKPQYTLEIERRHSQLIKTSRPVRRIAVTDSTTANYVQYSDKEVSVVGLELGKTDLTFWFQDSDTPSIFEVTVVRDASLEEQRTLDFGKLERRLRFLFPNSTVAIIPVASQVLVRGQAYDGEEAQSILQIVRAEVYRSLGRLGDDADNGAGVNAAVLSGLGGGGGGAGNGNNNGNRLNGFRDIVINELTIPGEFNIKMRVIVAEINRSEVRGSGFDWKVMFNDSRHEVGANLGGGLGTTLSGIFENGEIEVFIRALTSNGTIKLLAEPTIVCLSGTQASILAGGEFAVPTLSGLGGGQSTSFRGFGTSLIVTPTVMDRDLIRLMVVPEFSELNAANSVNSIPGTNVKRVNTQVELREGQTLAIGGLISRQESSEISRVPLLGDIPFIGSKVFHSKSAAELETELLVLVSPEIVRPMEPDEVPPLPGFNSPHPNDDELWKYGRTEGSPDNNVYQTAPLGSGSLHGVPQGYSLFNPPATHGGFPPATNGGSMMGNPGMGSPMGGPVMGGQPYGTGLQPQPDYSVPPGGSYVPPAGSYQGGQGQYYPSQQMQQISQPSLQYMPAPSNLQYPQYPPQGQFVPQQSQFVPQQGQFVPQPTAATQPTMLSRMGSVFRRNNAAPVNPVQTNPIKPAGWIQPIY